MVPWSRRRRLSVSSLAFAGWARRFRRARDPGTTIAWSVSGRVRRHDVAREYGARTTEESLRLTLSGSCRKQRRHHAVAGQWKITEAGAEGLGDGVADCRDGRAAGGFADSERRVVGDRVDQLDRDLGHLAEAQDRVALPVARTDAGGVEPHALLQGPADGLDDAAFELVDRAVRIDDEAGVGGAPDAGDADTLLDLDLGDDRGICGDVFVAGEGDAAAGGGRPTHSLPPPSAGG